MKKTESTKQSTAKKVYVKPQIVYRQPLEAMAAACTGVGAKATTGGPSFCSGGKLFS